jgi:hypothetical protein
MNIAYLFTLAKNVPAEGLKEGGWERAAQEMFGGAFENTHNVFPVTGFSIAAVGLIVLMLAIWGWKYNQQRHLRSTPMAIFHRIAGHLHLNLQQQWLLLRIARQQTLPSPLTLMLSSATLEHHASQYAKQMPQRRRSEFNARITAIRSTLFGSS